jgi:hypothetical protein
LKSLKLCIPKLLPDDLSTATDRMHMPIYSKIIISIILGLSLVFDLHQQTQDQLNQPTIINELREAAEISPIDLVWDMIAQVDQERALTDLRRLTGVEPICTINGCYTITGRETGSEGLQWAKDYIFEQLIGMGYYVEIQDWSMEGYSDQNLIIRKRGIVAPEEEIIYIAHVDGYLDNNPAADDDASGVVSLLELARILRGRYLSRTVVLIFSTGEEHGSLGSRSYVDQLTPAQLSAINYVVSVEMLGYDSNNDGAMQLWSGDQPTDFVQLLSQIITTYHLSLTPKIVTGCD